MLLVCFTRKENWFWRWGWCWLSGAGSQTLSLNVTPALFNWNSRPWSGCLFDLPRTVLPLNWCQISPSSAVLKQNTRHTSLTKSWLVHCPRSFSIFLLAAVTFNILRGSTYTSQVICCSQYPSSHRATGVREKFLPQIKWSEIKMLPQHVPWLATLKEIGPLAALTEAPQFPKTTRTQFDWIQYCDNKAGLLNESCTQFSYVREVEECCSNLASHFLPLLRLSVSIHCLTLS